LNYFEFGEDLGTLLKFCESIVHYNMDDNKTTDTPVEENKASTPVEDGAA